MLWVRVICLELNDPRFMIQPRFRDPFIDVRDVLLDKIVEDNHCLVKVVSTSVDSALCSLLVYPRYSVDCPGSSRRSISSVR